MKALSIVPFICSAGLFVLAGWSVVSAVPGGYTWAYAFALFAALIGIGFLAIGVRMFRSKYMSNSIVPLLIFIGVIALVVVWTLAYMYLAIPS